MTPPRAHGDRLGIVVGSGVSAGALAGGNAVAVPVEVGPGHHVEVLDAGTHVAPVRVQGRTRAEEPWRELGAGVFYRLERGGDVALSPAIALPVHDPSWPWS